MMPLSSFAKFSARPAQGRLRGERKLKSLGAQHARRRPPDVIGAPRHRKVGAHLSAPVSCLNREVLSRHEMVKRHFEHLVHFARFGDKGHGSGHKPDDGRRLEGGYRFMDYVKVGLPLMLLFLAVTLILVPLIWPL